MNKDTNKDYFSSNVVFINKFIEMNRFYTTYK